MTSDVKAGQKIAHFNSILRAIRNINQLIIRENDREKLIQGACDNLVETRGYSNAWIALFDESGKLVAHAECGLGKNFLPMVERLKRGQLPACVQRVLKQPEAVAIEDPVSTCADCPLSSSYAGRSAAAVRLEYGGKVCGLLSVSVPHELATDIEELDLFHGVATDIAFALHNMELEEERRQAEEQLMKIQRDLINAQKVAGTGSWTLSLPDLEVKWSEEMFRIFGLDPAGEPLSWPEGHEAYYHPDDWGWAKEEIETAISEGRGYDVEPRFFRPDGTTGYLRTRAEILFDESGKPEKVIGTSQDITERKQAEEKLRESEEKLRLMFESVTEGITLTDLNGNIVDTNDAAARLHGFDSGQQLVGRNAFELIPERDYARAMKNLKKTLEQGHGGTFEYTLVREDGSEFPGELSVALIRDASGNPTGLVAVTRDITERKQLVEERQKIEKLESIGTLAGGIAHDFNNILTGIMGNISLAKRHIEPKSKAEERLLEAEKASLRARDLTQQLLTFARGGAPVKTTASIAALLEEAATFALRGSKVGCEFFLPDDLCPVEIDEGQIHQVVTNLILNSIEAMPEGGILGVEARNVVIEKGSLSLPEGKYVEIVIKDFGIGIARKHLSKIFEPYFTTKQKGSGLGLATAYSIIRNHDGDIRVESKLGFGATFSIYLPASDKTIPIRKEGAAEQDTLLGGGRILVMDDEEIIRELLNSELTEAGYEVELTVNGAEAIEQYMKAKESGQPFDAVILDLTVPGGMGGQETIKKLLEIDPTVKAIVSSGYATDPIMSEYNQYGFSAVVPKPYNVTEIEKILQSLVGKKK